MKPYHNDEFSKYLVESTANYFDRYGMMYGTHSQDNDLIEEGLEILIDELLDEGYSVEDCISIFEDLNDDEVQEIFESMDLQELNPYAPAGSKEAKKYARAFSKSKKGAERAAKKAAVKARVKGKVVGALAAGQVAASGAKKSVSRRGAQAKAVASKVAGVAKKKAASLGSAIRGKASAAKASAIEAGKKAVSGAKFYGREIPGTAQSAGRMVKSAVTKRAGAAKAGLKQRIGQGALKVAKKMGVAEEMDVFDTILQYILDEGYAVSFQEAYEIMSELDDETVSDILEEVGFELIED